MDAVVETLRGFTFRAVLTSILACVAVMIRRYMKGTRFTEFVSASGKVAIVTGASSGIGKEVARELNLRGAKVYMLCRDIRKTERVIDRLVEDGCAASRLVFAYADLASFATIRAFVDKFLREKRCAQTDDAQQVVHSWNVSESTSASATQITTLTAHWIKEQLADESRLDILVNNAGVMGIPSFQRTVDGNEITFQCNHLGHFLLTDLLTESLCSSGHGRVVAVSSLVHLQADCVDEDVVNNPDRYTWIKAYQRSKLANMMHVRSLASQWRARGENRVTANACHPGAVYTNIMQHTLLNQEPIRTLLAPLLTFFIKNESDGAQTPLFLALSSQVDAISGEYFSDCAKAEMAALAQDAERCAELYEYSKRTVDECSNK